MTVDQCEKIVETLPYESRIGLIAFCAARCLNEGRRHAVARDQLENLPLLTEGVEMLWARAERTSLPDPARIDLVLEHVSTYEVPHPSGEGTVYKFDVCLVSAARVLMIGMPALQDQKSLTPPDVVGALESLELCIGAIYADWETATDAEWAVLEAAVQRLSDWGDKPFSRDVFAGIPEWPRGELSKRYVENRIRGSLPEEEDEDQC
jgi:hypothetical protein